MSKRKEIRCPECNECIAIISKVESSHYMDTCVVGQTRCMVDWAPYAVHLFKMKKNRVRVACLCGHCFEIKIE